MRRGDETIIQASRVGPEIPTDLRRNLAAVLEMWLADAFVLVEYGFEREAAIIGKLVAQVEDAAEEWLTWLSEADAITRSGHGKDWLRARFTRWQARGHARRTPDGDREYRAVIIPIDERRPIAPPTRSAYEAGLRGERPSQRGRSKKPGSETAP